MDDDSADLGVSVSDATAASLAGVSRVTVRVWVHRGNVQRTADGRIDADSLLRYLDGRGTRGRHRER